MDLTKSKLLSSISLVASTNLRSKEIDTFQANQTTTIFSGVTIPPQEVKPEDRADLLNITRRIFTIDTGRNAELQVSCTATQR